MIGLKINQAKGMFFDAPKVVRAVDAATHRVLLKFGAFVRTAAKSSIRQAATKRNLLKKIGDAKTKEEKERLWLEYNKATTSEPGKPPKSHTGLLKQYIFFGYDTARQSVVSGPVALHGGNRRPESLMALEYGGTSTLLLGRRRSRGSRKITVAARPFMDPALKQELPKLPAMWANSVKP